jgi:DNA-binding MarR family transcriptional regulator
MNSSGRAKASANRRARLSRQTMTTMVHLLEREGLVRRERDRDDARLRVVLTIKARRFEPVAERTLTELAVLAQRRLGGRRLTSVKHALEERIET